MLARSLGVTSVLHYDHAYEKPALPLNERYDFQEITAADDVAGKGVDLEAYEVFGISGGGSKAGSRQLPSDAHQFFHKKIQVFAPRSVIANRDTQAMASPNGSI